MSVMRALRSLAAICSLAAACVAAADVPDPCEQGREFFLQNNYLAAEPLLRRCLEQGENLLALLPLTMMAVIQQRTAEALDYGTRALVLAPDNVNVRYWYGRSLLLAGRNDEAQEQWEQGISLDGGHAGILEGLARLSLHKGQPARAYNLMRQILLQGNDADWVHRTLAELAQRQGYWQQAAAHWRDVIDREGPSEENVATLGELLILAGNSEAAVELFRDMTATLPTASIYGGLGEALFTLDQIDSAAAAFQKAIALDPDQPRHFFNMANAMQLMDRHEEARDHYLAYLEKRPDDPVGRFHYGVHLIDGGESQEAVTHLEKAVQGDVGYIEARVVLAHVYQDLGRNEEALSLIDQLTVLDPGSHAELDSWRAQLQHDLAQVTDARDRGKVQLLHIVVAESEIAAAVSKELSRGTDFNELAARFSLGPTAARGGDIGWIDPADMAPRLRQAIEKLEPDTTSPPIETEGQIHIFKRIR